MQKDTKDGNVYSKVDIQRYQQKRTLHVSRKQLVVDLSVFHRRTCAQPGPYVDRAVDSNAGHFERCRNSDIGSLCPVGAVNLKSDPQSAPRRQEGRHLPELPSRSLDGDS